MSVRRKTSVHKTTAIAHEQNGQVNCEEIFTINWQDARKASSSRFSALPIGKLVVFLFGISLLKYRTVFDDFKIFTDFHSSE